MKNYIVTYQSHKHGVMHGLVQADGIKKALVLAEGKLELLAPGGGWTVVGVVWTLAGK